MQYILCVLHFLLQPEMNIVRANTNDIQVIQQLAAEIWPIAYKDILSIAQLNFMLHEFYHAEAIKNQMLTKGHQFFIIKNERDEALGFASVSHENKHRFKLQKLYVLTNYQGQQLGVKLLNKVIEYSIENGASKLILNVNRFNKARLFYEKQGFNIIEEVDIHIGNNYYMNDYVMERNL